MFRDQRVGQSATRSEPMEHDTGRWNSTLQRLYISPRKSGVVFSYLFLFLLTDDGFFRSAWTDLGVWALGWTELGVNWETTAWMVVLVFVLFTCSVLFLYALHFSSCAVYCLSYSSPVSHLVGRRDVIGSGLCAFDFLIRRNRLRAKTRMSVSDLLCLFSVSCAGSLWNM